MSDYSVALEVAKRFGPEYETAAKQYVKSRDFVSLRDILTLMAEVLGTVQGIYFVINYLRKHRDAKDSDAALDISGLPIDERKLAERIIKEVRSEMNLPPR